MSKRIEPCLFRCSVCSVLSPADESTVTFQSGGCLRLMMPTGWKAIASPFVGARELVDFLCPRCNSQANTQSKEVEPCSKA